MSIIRKSGWRIIPQYDGHWDNKQPYENLIFVDYQGLTYCSKKPVPEGIDINNSEFWSEGVSFNAQVEAMRQECLRVVNEANARLSSFDAEINGKFDLMLNEAKEDVENYLNESRVSINTQVEEINTLVNTTLENANEKMDNLERTLSQKLTNTENNVNSYLETVRDLLNNSDDIIVFDCNIPTDYTEDITIIECI